MLLDLILYVFVIATVVQLVYWWAIFRRLAFHKVEHSQTPTSEEFPVTVIICAKNEANNLKKNLPRIINQNYRCFEILVANDGSTDDTEQVIYVPSRHQRNRQTRAFAREKVGTDTGNKCRQL